jgi:hypothetical protein
MDRRNLLSIAALVVAVVCAVGWFHAHQRLQDAKQAQVADTLNPIGEMLKENAAITKELEAAPFAEGDNQFVSAYLIKIRRDGVPKHSDMKQRIDRIVNNDTAILALLSKDSTHARTPAFKASAERFRDYAISQRDRWQSVPEIFMAGGNLPVTAPPFPADFAGVVSSEITAQR